MGRASDGEHDDARYEEADAGKQHLAARHIRRDLKLVESEFDQRIGPSPKEGCRKREDCGPDGVLENGGWWMVDGGFHVTLSLQFDC